MSKINSKSTKAELEAYIKELEAKLQADGSGSDKEPVAVEKVETKTVKQPSNEVTLVYCSDSLGYAKISNMEFNFNRYGEEFQVPRYQFDELVGKYREWFNRGILAVGANDVDVAAAKGIPTVKEFALDYNKLSSIGRMSVAEVEKLWNSCKMHAHKESIVFYVKRKFIEGDPQYRRRELIDLLNGLTDGSFRREQDELSGRYKIAQTDM